MQSPSRRRVPRWVAVTVPLILCAGVAGCVVFYWPWITRPRIGSPQHPLPYAIECPAEPSFARRDFEEQFIGHEEKDVLARFGAPAERFNGHYGAAPVAERRKYPEAHTAVLAGHGGRLYLSFCQQRGRWVCFAASWLPEGAAF
jgi:hypothetical protein